MEKYREGYGSEGLFLEKHTQGTLHKDYCRRFYFTFKSAGKTARKLQLFILYKFTVCITWAYDVLLAVHLAVSIDNWG